jgi:circadian clock protein KaiB
VATRSTGVSISLLKLFVTTYATSSHRAIHNLTSILKENFEGLYRLEIIDIKNEPALAVEFNITAVPLLVKDINSANRRLVGDMSDREKVKFWLI